MARIRVTGYIDTTGLDPDYVDLTDDTGLSENGFIDVPREMGLEDLDDIEFEVED
jgi:hypothetical protein